jgi:hypothetical protein
VISIIVLVLGPARELFYAVIPGVIYCVVFRERDPHRPELRAKKNPDPAEAEPGFLDLLSF